MHVYTCITVVIYSSLFTTMYNTSINHKRISVYQILCTVFIKSLDNSIIIDLKYSTSFIKKNKLITAGE